MPALYQLVTTRANLIHHISLALPNWRLLVDGGVTNDDALLGCGRVQVWCVLPGDLEVGIGPVVLHLDGLG